MADGLEPSEARRQARIAVGGPEQVKESCRDARGTRWLEDLWQDLRYALRTIRQRPGFAAVVALTLAVGIGSTTLMFTVLNGVLFKPFPYRSPERLFSLQEKTAKVDAAWRPLVVCLPELPGCPQRCSIDRFRGIPLYRRHPQPARRRRVYPVV
jgi:hypothetical protein